jgi:hypothetical protein
MESIDFQPTHTSPSHKQSVQSASKKESVPYTQFYFHSRSSNLRPCGQQSNTSSRRLYVRSNSCSKWWPLGSPTLLNAFDTSARCGFSHSDSAWCSVTAGLLSKFDRCTLFAEVWTWWGGISSILTLKSLRGSNRSLKFKSRKGCRPSLLRFIFNPFIKIIKTVNGQ